MNEFVVIPEAVFLHAAFDTHLAVQTVLFVTILLAGALLAGKIGRYLFSMPEVAGQIVGGIILGPTGFDIARFCDVSLFFSTASELFSGQVFECGSSSLGSYFILMLSGVFAVPYLLWMAGHETDVDIIRRVGFSAIVSGILGALFPIGMIAAGLYAIIGTHWSMAQITGMGLVFAATSVSIAIAVLFSYGKMHSRAAQVTLGAAVADDIVAVVLLSLYMASSHQQDAISMYSLLGHISLALALIGLIGYFVVRPIVQWLSDNQWHDFLPSIATVIMGLFFVLAETVGHLAGITGAYFAGLFHRMGDEHRIAEKRIAAFVHAVFLPLFLGSIGLQVNMRLLSLFDWGLLVVILILAILSKMIACVLVLCFDNACNDRMPRWTGAEMWVFSASMVARGEVGLIVSTILYGAHIFTQQQYVIAVIVVTLTTMISPILLVPGLRKLPHDIHKK